MPRHHRIRMSRDEIKIRLKKNERTFLKNFLRKGTKKARAIARASILLMANKGMSTESIVEATGTHRQTVWRIKKRYVADGLEQSLKEKSRPGQPVKYTQKHEAEIIALACTDPPKGRKRWTIQLLADALRSRNRFKSANRESVRLVLKKRGQSLG